MANDTAVKRTPAKKAAAPAKKAPARKTAAKKSPAPLPPPGWYPDPAEPDVQRYWDGEGWSPNAPTPPVEVDPAVGADNGGAPAAAAGTITFRGRVMAYRRPTSDQLAVWKMLADRAQSVVREMATPKPCPTCKGSGCETCEGTGSAHTAAVLKLFKRTVTIINSVMVDEADRDWLEDELIAGKLDLLAASEIVNLTVAQLVASQQPAAAPRHGPLSKARRRR